MKICGHAQWEAFCYLSPIRTLLVRSTPLHGCVQVTSEILGYGSCGTIVFSGTLDGRQVAVKRILRQFNELAHKEISALIVSDEVHYFSSAAFPCQNMAQHLVSKIRRHSTSCP